MATILPMQYYPHLSHFFHLHIAQQGPYTNNKVVYESIIGGSDIHYLLHMLLLYMHHERCSALLSLLHHSKKSILQLI